MKGEKRKTSGTGSKFDIRKGFRGTGYILGEYGFLNDPREMAFSTKEEVLAEIEDIFDCWAESED